ncbi:hypothetical protein [Francisella persica]|uniref:hypothetical protein n=1 Tax=Francisella persica TaxID=954 RepID=UPI000A959166|nr:hypothetical protein [Francisella persica]
MTINTLQALHKCCDDLVLSILCCGFVGDKGFTITELSTNSLASLKPQIKDCEI